MRKFMTLLLLGGTLALVPHAVATAQDTPREARIEGRAEARTVADANRWRYRYHDGRWWYWTPQRSWVYWGGNQWNPYRRGVAVDRRYGRDGYYDRDYGRNYYRGYRDGYRYRNDYRYGRGRYDYRGGYRGYYDRPGVYIGRGGAGIRF
jgi:hypothetical protein